jgi:hypothetical protein
MPYTVATWAGVVPMPSSVSTLPRPLSGGLVRMAPSLRGLESGRPRIGYGTAYGDSGLAWSSSTQAVR